MFYQINAALVSKREKNLKKWNILMFKKKEA